MGTWQYFLSLSASSCLSVRYWIPRKLSECIGNYFIVRMYINVCIFFTVGCIFFNLFISMILEGFEAETSSQNALKTESKNTFCRCRTLFVCRLFIISFLTSLPLLLWFVLLALLWNSISSLFLFYLSLSSLHSILFSLFLFSFLSFSFIFFFLDLFVFAHHWSHFDHHAKCHIQVAQLREFIHTLPLWVYISNATSIML